MNLSNLQPAEGSTHNQNKRLGRGEGSGKGGTAARGHKGAKSRSGYSKKIGFEGGQMPLQRRVPKFGFTNINRKEFAIVNLEALNRFEEGTEVTPELLIETGVVSNEKSGIKILAKGNIEKKLTVKAHKFSSSAKEAIEAAGGSAEVI